MAVTTSKPATPAPAAPVGPAKITAPNPAPLAGASAPAAPAPGASSTSSTATYQPPPGPITKTVANGPVGQSTLAYTPAGSNFLSLVQSVLGDAGSSSDGQDAQLLAAVTALTQIGNLIPQGDVLLQAADSANTIIQGIDDPIGSVLLAGQALYDAQETGLFDAIDSLGELSAESLAAVVGSSLCGPCSGAGAGSSPSSGSSGGGGGSSSIGTAPIIGTVLGAILTSPSTGPGAALAAFTGGASAGPIGLAVAAGIVLISLLIHFIGGGCGDACIDSAKAEQIYEAAADNLWAVAHQLGMLDRSDYYTLVYGVLQAGQIHMQALSQSGDKKAEAGLANMNQIIEAELALNTQLPAKAPHALNITQAQSVYIKDTAPKWYASSIDAASQITTQFLTTGAANLTAAVVYLAAQS